MFHLVILAFDLRTYFLALFPNGKMCSQVKALAQAAVTIYPHIFRCCLPGSGVTFEDFPLFLRCCRLAYIIFALAYVGREKAGEYAR